ncbi:MAG: outer membrane protein assembly factor BamB family protein [Planctomycetota bacterium]|jgi:outer membrane protein assembly factor BamB
MAMRVFLVALLATTLACKGKKPDEGDGRVTRGGEAVTPAMGRDAIETALAELIDGRVLRIDLNAGKPKKQRIRIRKAHLTKDLLLLETDERQPRLWALQRDDLYPRWQSELHEPTAFPIAANRDTMVLVSKHFAHALETDTGRRALQFFRGGLSGLRQPHLDLPFSPTGGAAVGNDTFYIPSLGNPSNNKTLESFSLVTGQRGWGYRTSGDIMTTPIVTGGIGDPKLYFVTTSGLVTCMDATNYGYAPDRPRWEELLETGVDHDFFVTEDARGEVGSIFLVDREGMVYCLNRITGERRWVNATGLKPVGAPAVFGDICIVKMTNGLCGFDRTNVVYRLIVESGPEEGNSYWVRAGTAYTLGSGDKVDLTLSDKAVGATHLTLKVEGEVLTATTSGEHTMRLDGGKAGKREIVRDGSLLAIGNTILRIEDRGSAPLWCGLKYDRIVGMVGDVLIAQSGATLAALNPWNGAVVKGPYDLAGMRVIPANTTSGTLFAVGGDAITYALFPR